MYFDTPANDNPDEKPPERRREARRRVLLQGQIVYPHNRYTAQCVIRDLSCLGARISVAADALSREPFLIVVRDGLAHSSSQVWSNPRFTGLQFRKTYALRDTVPHELKTMQQLWIDLDLIHRADQQGWRDLAPR